MKVRLITVSVLLAAFAAAGCQKDAGVKKAPRKTEATKAGDRLDIAVTKDGFEPEDVTVPAATPVTLVFERTTDDTCVKEVILELQDGTKVTKELPLNTPVELAANFPKAGKLRYACGMDMYSGTITVH